MSLTFQIAAGVFIGQVATSFVVAGINYYTETQKRKALEKAMEEAHKMAETFLKNPPVLKPAPRKKPAAKNTTVRKSEKKVVAPKRSTPAKKGGKK